MTETSDRMPGVLRNFVHVQLGVRVVFGDGARARVPEEVRRLAATRILNIATRSTKAHADVLVQHLGRAVVARLDGVAPHVPMELAREAVATARRADADLVICIGGGSVTGLAKAVAKETGVPILAIPSTYAGSEMTPIWGVTESGRKTTGRDVRVAPRVVIYDPELTLDLPPAVSAASGMNAMAHCVEGLYAPDVSPVSLLLAEEGIRTLATWLPPVIEQPSDRHARSETLSAAWLAGSVLGTTRMGIHHTICHVLGGTFGLPHAGSHSAVLPHALAYNAGAIPEAMSRLRQCLSSPDPAGSLWDLARRIEAPTALADLGFRSKDAAEAAELVVSAAPANPRPVDKEEVRLLLLAAHEGLRPASSKEEFRS